MALLSLSNDPPGSEQLVTLVLWDTVIRSLQNNILPKKTERQFNRYLSNIGSQKVLIYFGQGGEIQQNIKLNFSGGGPCRLDN